MMLLTVIASFWNRLKTWRFCHFPAAWLGPRTLSWPESQSFGRKLAFRVLVALKLLLSFGRRLVDKALNAVDQILTHWRNQAREWARRVRLLAGQVFTVASRVVSSVRRFAARLFAVIVDSLSYMWMIWTRERATTVVFYLAGILLMTMFVVVVIGVIDFYRAIPSTTVLAVIAQVAQRLSLQALIVIFVGLILLWGLLGYVARETLVVLSFTRIWGTKFLDYVIRLLSSLPTLILGNAILVLASAIRLFPRGPLANLALVIVALVLIGLPTVLQIGREMLRDYDKKEVHQAVALGVSRVVIGKRVVMPSIRRSFDAAITLAISRIVIEGYIVLNQVAFDSSSGTRMLRDSEDLVDIFSGIYSTMTIQSNIGLISLLFILAVVANIWSFSITTIQKP